MNPEIKYEWDPVTKQYMIWNVKTEQFPIVVFWEDNDLNRGMQTVIRLVLKYKNPIEIKPNRNTDEIQNN